MGPRRFFSLLKETFHAWKEDKAPRLGAALAYYSMFSIAPLLIIAIGIASLVFGEQAARGEIVDEITSTVGQPAAEAIEAMLKNTGGTGGSALATLIGLVLLLFGASGVFIQLQDALNTIWKVTPKSGRGILGVVRDRLLSLMVVFGTGFLLLVSLAISVGLAAWSKFWTPAALPGGAYLWQGVNGLVSFALITLLFAMIYKVLPDAQIAWRHVWTGAAVTALLFAAGKYLIGLYLGQSSTMSTFGAAGSLVVLLVWVYYSSQILLFGAEFTRINANRASKLVTPTDNAVAVAPETRARQGMSETKHLEQTSGHGD